MVIEKLVVVGLGLIGGSLACALKRRHQCREVIGIARRQSVCERACHLQVVDRAFTELESVAGELGEKDLIFVAVPTLSIKELFHKIHSCVSSRVTVTDGASVKGSVLKDVIEVYGEAPAQVVMGHPIAGSEKSGVDASDENLYENHRVILTPTKNNTAEHLNKVRSLWQVVGADVVEMTVEDHDDILAATSHLPHAIAFSLVDTLAHDRQNENIFRYAAGGFRDFTRIASSDAIMWRDIMLANRDAILHAIDLFSNNMQQLRKAVEKQDEKAIAGIFTRAKSARDRFTKMIEHKAYRSNMRTADEKNMIYKLAPGGEARGTIRVPGDKSISHRSIMLGALAEGVTNIDGFLEGEDALATLHIFRDLGVAIDGPKQGRVTVHGVGMRGLESSAGALYVGNSGTSMRLLAGLLAGQSFDSELVGDESLSKRPMNRVAIPLGEMGAKIATSAQGHPPVKIQGSAQLKGIDYVLPMASAQVKSCLLLAGLYAEGETRVTEPAPTRDHTERMLRGFGYQVKTEGNVISLESGGKLKACDIDVPADISSAAFFLVAAAITPDSDITLTHVGVNPTRIGVINILRMMGANLVLDNECEVGGEPVADIRIRYAPLKGISIPENQVPLAIDEFPALCIAAACAQGTTTLTGAEELRVKETDRIQAMADGLAILGISCSATHDGIIIEGGQLQSGSVESYGDHRIAMAFSIACLQARGDIVVNNCANVATSFPNFPDLAAQIGISLEVIHS